MTVALDRPLTARDVLRATWRIDVAVPPVDRRCARCRDWLPDAPADEPGIPAAETASNAAWGASATPVRVDWAGARRALDRLARPPKRAARRPRERSRRK